jgi:hypothetical protein
MSHGRANGRSRHIEFIPVGETQGETQDSTNRGSSSGERPDPVTASTHENPNVAGSSSELTGENIISTAIIQSLDNTVESFRKGDLSKARAISKLVSTLSISNDSTDDPAKEAALDQYISSIDSFSRTQSHSARYGQIVDHGLRTDVDQTANHDDIERIISEIAESSKHGSSFEEEEISGETDRSDSEREPSNKKRRLYEKDMPWFKRESIARQSADPSCQATRRILQTFGSDFAYVKRSIQLAQSAPAGFPASEWDNIVRGISVNIDNVFSSLHHVAPVKENVGRVGSTEISLGHTEPSRRVRTNGDWISAYNEIVKATAFVFPHREQELRDYGEYINREFSSKVDSSHKRIILYDAAVRNEVGGGQQMLLTDRSKFSFIYSAIVMPDGIESDFGKRKASAFDGNKSQSNFCRRFNSANGCSDGSDCRYKHLCRNCKRPSHSQVNCDSQSRKGSRTST